MRSDNIEALFENLERPEPSAALYQRIMSDADAVLLEREAQSNSVRPVNKGIWESFLEKLSPAGLLSGGLAGGALAAGLAVLMISSTPVETDGFASLSSDEVAYLEGYLFEFPFEEEIEREELAFFGLDED